MFLYWQDAAPASRTYSFQIMRMLAEAPQGAGDFSEIHRAARRIRAGVGEDWHREFLALGDVVLRIGEEASDRGHVRTASDALMRAFGYYRSAEWVLDGDDDRKLPLYERAVACFRRALDLGGHRYEQISIPWEGRRLAGYLFPAEPVPDDPAGGVSPAPCIVFLSGADALPEENFFRGVRHITSRGCACALVNGPGQGSTLRLDGVPTIPDYERPVSAVVDYLETRDDVDGDRLGLLGVSMAGYYAPRAAAFEPRFKACVIWGALFDVLNDLFDPYPAIRGQLQWIAGVSSEEEARARYESFTLDGVLEHIRCPVLITHGAGDHMVPLSSAQRTFDQLTVQEKELRVYDQDEGGAEHCNIDNFVQVIPYQVDWLIDRIA